MRSLRTNPGILAGVFLIVCASISLFIGVIDINPVSLFSADEEQWLLAASRLPRTIAILFTGSSLAIAGLVMQILVQNRFVEPSTAGGGESAVLGILLATLFFPAAPLLGKMAIASVTALLGTLVLLLIIRRLPPHDNYMIPLVGIIYGGVIGAIATWVGWQTDLIQFVDIWMTGEFSGVMRGRYDFLWIAAALAVMSYYLANQFTIASLGEAHARNLGLNFNAILSIGLIIISVTTAVTVVTVGVIPFIGLIIPNIVSRWWGDNLRRSLPKVAYLGALLTLLCDMIGRLVIYPYEVPVGVVFGVFGAAVTLWLLYSAPSTKPSE